MNKIIPILSFLVLLTYSLLGQTVVSVSNVTSPKGEEVLVPINATINGVGSVNLNLQYDGDVLTFVEVANNNLAGGSFVVNPQGDSLISIAWFSTSPVDIASKILDLKFVYNGGNSDVSFVGTNQIADSLSNPINTQFTNGSVGPVPISFTLSDETGVPGDTVEVEMTAVNLENIGAMNLYLNYNDSNATFLGMGDINLAGFVANGVADRVNLGMFNASGYSHSSGVIATLKFVIVTGNTDIAFDTSSFVQDISFNNFAVNYTNGSVGEVSATFVLGDVSAVIDSEVIVPISGLKLKDIGSFNMDVLYDSDVLEFVRIENVESGTLVGNATTDTLSLGYFNTEGLTVLDGHVADLVFNYLGDSTDVSFDASSADIQDVDFNSVSLDFVDGSVVESTAPVEAEYPVVEAATDGTLDQPWIFNAAGGAGSIVVSDSTTSAWGSHVVTYADSGYTGLALVKKIFTESYTVSSDIYLVGEIDANFPLYTGLAIKSASDELKYYRFIYRNSSSDMGQLKLQGYDGSWHISKKWNVGTEIEQLATGWHNFKITIDGNKMYAYMDNELLSGSPISVTGADAFLTEGMPGIFVYNGSGGTVTFDNFKVEENTKLEYTIAEVQTPADGDTTGSSPLVGMDVITSGVVTATQLNDDGAATQFYIQDGVGAYSGVAVYSTQMVSVGDSVTLQGEVAEYFGKTELKNVSGLDIHASDSTLVPDAVALSTAAVNDEQYEGVLVSVTDAQNTSENSSHGEALFDDGTGEVMTDDLLTDAYTFVLGDIYRVTGVVDYSFDNYKILYRSADDVSLLSGVEEENSEIPMNYELSQNYPNPFNPTTVIQYALPSQSNVKINVYNTLGQLVTKLVNSDVASGYHQVQFNASNLSSGVYFYSIKADAIDGSKSFQVVKKMMLVK